MRREQLRCDSTQGPAHTWSWDRPDTVILAHTLQSCILRPLRTKHCLDRCEALATSGRHLNPRVEREALLGLRIAIDYCRTTNTFVQIRSVVDLKGREAGLPLQEAESIHWVQGFTGWMRRPDHTARDGRLTSSSPLCLGTAQGLKN